MQNRPRRGQSQAAVTVRLPTVSMAPMANGTTRWKVGCVNAIEKLMKGSFAADGIESIIESFPIYWLLELCKNEIIEAVFKPRYIKPPPQKAGFSHIVDIYTNWHKNCLFFHVKFACPGPNALLPFFEDSFTRLAYMANECFNLAYMRHTSK